MGWDEVLNRPLLAVWGEPVVHVPAAAGLPLARTGIYDAPGSLVDTGDGEPVRTTAPLLSVVLADWDPAPVAGDAIERAGVIFAITDVAPDGTGMAVLTLRQAPP